MPTSILDGLYVGATGICEIQVLLHDDFILTVVTKDAFLKTCHKLTELHNICDNLSLDSKFRPSVGDLVAAQSPTVGWQRAHVLSIIENSYRIAMFDVGISQKKITKLKPLQIDFQSIPELGARATIHKYEIDQELFKKLYLKPTTLFFFKVIKCTIVSCTIQLLSKEERNLLCEVFVIPWRPKFEDAGLKCMKLTNKELVDVVSYSSCRTLYIRPVNELTNRDWHSVIQKVGSHCLSVDNLEYMPDKGELVACRCDLDGNYYRGLVVGHKDDDIVLISYVDIGSFEHVSKTELKPLSEDLKKIPCQAILVKLKNVQPQPLTRCAVNFLNKLVASNGLLTVVFDNSYSNDGVELNMANNKPISKKISSYLQPSWKSHIVMGKNPSDTYFADDCLQMKLPIGKYFELFILHLESDDIVYACQFDNDISHYVLTVLPTELFAYCEALSATCYVPRMKELSLVKYKNRWWRGTCKEVGNFGALLFLVDFGMTIMTGYHNIRKICQDFLIVPSIAVLCIFEGAKLENNCMEECSSSEVKKRVHEPFTKHIVKVHSFDEDSYHYRLHMPDVQKTLQKEELMVDSKCN